MHQYKDSMTTLKRKNNCSSQLLHRQQKNKQKNNKNKETEIERKTTGKTRIGLRKGNLKRETESLLIEAQNNTIRSNYIKVKIDMQQNSWYRLCGERGEMVNNNKLMHQTGIKRIQYRHDWMGKVIH